MSIKITDSLLAKFLAHEASDKEIENIEHWLSENETNKIYFNEFNLIWKESSQFNNEMNENEAWERFKQYRSTKLEQESSVKTRKILFLKSFKQIAAIFILVLASASVIYFISISKNDGQMLLSSGANIRTDTLFDGSIVTLNKQSTLAYNRNTDLHLREVTLHGEAFFQVAPDKKKPFFIYTGKEKIKVVGTSFNVKRKTGNLEVIVKTGIVEVSNSHDTVRLLPGEMITIDEKGTQQKQIIDDQLYSYYFTKKFVCQNTSLKRFVDALNNSFNTKIIIANPKLEALLLTTTFENENLEDILLVVSKTFNIRLEKTADQIKLY